MHRMNQPFVRNFPANGRQPDVVVTFTGLLMLRFDYPNSLCQIGVHPDPDHYLRMAVELRQRANDRLKNRWEYSFPDGLTDNLLINVTNPRLEGVTRYEQPHPLSRRGNEQETAEEEALRRKDSRWAMHLGWFHAQSVAMPESRFARCIQINNGLFFAAQLGGAGRLALRSKKHGFLFPKPEGQLAGAGIVSNRAKTALVLEKIAEEIGANIYLQPSESEVRWQWAKSENATNFFPFSSLQQPPRGFYYKLTFNNDCRHRSPHTCDERLKEKKYKSDLPLYYELLATKPAEGVMDIEGFLTSGEIVPCSPILEP